MLKLDAEIKAASQMSNPGSKIPGLNLQEKEQAQANMGSLLDLKYDLIMFEMQHEENQRKYWQAIVDALPEDFYNAAISSQLNNNNDSPPKGIARKDSVTSDARSDDTMNEDE